MEFVAGVMGGGGMTKEHYGRIELSRRQVSSMMSMRGARWYHAHLTFLPVVVIIAIPITCKATFTVDVWNSVHDVTLTFCFSLFFLSP